MRQPQISDQGYLEPVTRLINCHFGQLIHTCHVCMYCHGYEQLTCLLEVPVRSSSSSINWDWNESRK
jgi:hypothetical protein